MAGENRLARNIRAIAEKTAITIYQGVVTATDGNTCSVRFGSQVIDGIRLRASLSDVDRQFLVTPKVGTAVIVGSLSGDLSELVVLQADEVESIEINGGRNGSFINILDLTAKLNNLVNEVNSLKDTFNSHTHSGTVTGTAAGGVVTGKCICSAPAGKAGKASKFDYRDYEDTAITH